MFELLLAYADNVYFLSLTYLMVIVFITCVH